MNKSFRIVKLLVISTAGGVVWGGGCLPDNFWVDKWAEVINRAIFGAINAALTGELGAI